MSRESKGMPPMPEKEKTHQQEAIEHQEYFLPRKYKNEIPHDIIIGVEESKCRTCREKWPKTVTEVKKDEPFEVDPAKRKY